MSLSNSSKLSLCTRPEVISLTDCLACSGCITSEESADFFSSLTFLEDKTTPFAFIVSPQSKMNLRQLFPKMSFLIFEKNLIKFIKSYFNIEIIVDSSYFKKEIETAVSSSISSECPAVVLYVERVYPELLKYLSTAKTYQQRAADFIRKEMKKNCKIISLMQCYDKKDEGKRDNTEIEYFVGSREFGEFLKKNLEPDYNLEYELEPWERTYLQKVDEVSGLENCVNLFNRAKTQPIGQVEMRICKGGCMGGPAQIKFEEKEKVLDNFEEFQNESPFEMEFSKRVFAIGKKKTFKVDW